MAIGSNGFEWVKFYKSVVYQYNNTIHRATRKKPFNVFRGIDILNKIVVPIVSDNNSIQKEARQNLNTYATKYAKNENDFVDFNVNDIVILLKDFDNNKKTKKNPLDSIYYPEEYTVVKVSNSVLTIMDILGNQKVVVNSRLRKLNQ
ncbi:hypothetical protein DMUE_5865 [Dictyocoela muelleri]|nr:hypothetical protein DMUE_5865 [Dictyocoela muelleri]